MEWVFVKMMLSLAAVLGLMFSLVYVMKRFVLPGRPSTTARVEIEVLGQRALGPKRSIVVVKVLQQILVLGVSEQGVHVLTEQPDHSVEAESVSDKDRTQHTMRTGRGVWKGVGSFADHLQAYAHALGKR